MLKPGAGSVELNSPAEMVRPAMNDPYRPAGVVSVSVLVSSLALSDPGPTNTGRIVMSFSEYLTGIWLLTWART